jgi:hypothetical protein
MAAWVPPAVRALAAALAPVSSTGKTVIAATIAL